LPTEAIASVTVDIVLNGMSADALARSLRADPACVFGRIESNRVRLDMRTITDAQIPRIAEALARIVQSNT